MILLHKLWLPHIFWWLADCGLNPENHLRQSMQVSPEGNQFDLRLLLHPNRILDCMFIFRLAAWIGISTSLDNWQTADSIRKIFSVTEWRYKLKKKRIQWVTLPSNYADKLHNLWPCSLFFFRMKLSFQSWCFFLLMMAHIFRMEFRLPWILWIVNVIVNISCCIMHLQSLSLHLQEVSTIQVINRPV